MIPLLTLMLSEGWTFVCLFTCDLIVEIMRSDGLLSLEYYFNLQLDPALGFLMQIICPTMVLLLFSCPCCLQILDICFLLHNPFWQLQSSYNFVHLCSLFHDYFEARFCIYLYPFPDFETFDLLTMSFLFLLVTQSYKSWKFVSITSAFLLHFSVMSHGLLKKFSPPSPPPPSFLFKLLHWQICSNILFEFVLY